MSSSKAKRAGRSLHLREDWEVVKDSIMEEFIYQKFSKKEFKDKLLATGLATLIEGNTWNDTYWGVCNGAGFNRLGKILMKVRGALHDQK